MRYVQVALEEAELALEQEEGKLLKVQLELTQLKQATEKKFSERDEELENMRKNHQRQIESLQNTIDSEQRSRNEQAKQRKQHDAELSDLEAQLETANRQSAEYQKQLKKMAAQIKVIFKTLNLKI